MNGKPLQYSCLENAMNNVERQYMCVCVCVCVIVDKIIVRLIKKYRRFSKSGIKQGPSQYIM